jgi:hypothetical protein
VSDWRDIPVYVTNRNTLERGFRQQLEWLQRAGMKSITIIDNESTYPPLLDFYAQIAIPIIHTPSNIGPEAFWEMGMHGNMQTRFIVTDADIVPDSACPLDLVGKMLEVAERYGAKTGPGLRIDDLPDWYSEKQRVLIWETQFWQKRKDAECFDAAIHNHFGLYQPGWAVWPNAPHLRLDFPYVARHLPWYEDSSAANVEREYYRARVKSGVTNW